jgi:hypothetical protein
MTRTICCLAGLALAATAALAQDRPAPSGEAPDMTKMGPMSRPVTKEDKKGVDELFKNMEQAWKSGDINAVAENVDFPVLMLSDDSSGAVKYFTASREQWMAIMKPMMTNMPKDLKMTHKHTATFLSDTLAVAIGEESVSGKMKGKWKSMSVLTNQGGRWKIKQMAEAGWGDMKPPAAASAPGGTPPSGAPANR